MRLWNYRNFQSKWLSTRTLFQKAKVTCRYSKRILDKIRLKSTLWIQNSCMSTNFREINSFYLFKKRKEKSKSHNNNCSKRMSKSWWTKSQRESKSETFSTRSKSKNLVIPREPLTFWWQNSNPLPIQKHKRKSSTNDIQHPNWSKVW